MQFILIIWLISGPFHHGPVVVFAVAALRGGRPVAVPAGVAGTQEPGQQATCVGPDGTPAARDASPAPGTSTPRPHA
ncbi:MULTISPECIES: hypothetical protein [unclassified Pseudofrankia]|uniref:hypothetical protein n=1 Tax=unclassified Pseudofrankia TaxID=2994372 RepID=UPI0008DA5EF0|nr:MULTISPECIES: hypothetical protein [unclassified Pseudofrankia]MDT3441664.1 hypothetical protein [Pseudofrankia sp. BMG5.37]OHV50125.1 hypothetical protein BCD48_10990 [Pseudofrankia sp. BMG5.36]